MFKNYLISTFRNFTRQQIYSILNIVGLAMGIACTVLAMLYVQHEMSYDKFHQDADRTYLLYSKYDLGDSEDQFAVVLPALPHAILEDVPEVEDVIRLRRRKDTQLVVNEEKYEIENLYYCDTNFFEFFDFKLIDGKKENILTEPNSAILSVSQASRIFGEENPIGKTINLFKGESFVVNGIVEDSPANSQIEYDILISINAYDQDRLLSWSGLILWSYIKLQENAVVADVVEKINEVKQTNCKDSWARLTVDIFPMLDIHLHSDISDSVHTPSSYVYVLGYSLIALFILLLACFNFINLSTARSGKRAREVGVRKVFGASRKNLVFQFLSESFLFALIAIVIALTLVELLLPYFNNLAERSIDFNLLTNLPIAFGLMAILFIVGIVSGSFPAFYLSSFVPIEVLKGSNSPVSKGGRLRKALVVGQFVISIALIISAVTVHNQMLFMQAKRLGFEKDQLVTLNMGGHHGTVSGIETLKSELLKVEGVEQATLSNNYPFSSIGQTTLLENVETAAKVETWLWAIDQEFIPTYQMKMADGRNLDKSMGSDEMTGVVINEALVKKMGWKDSPLGKPIDLPSGGHSYSSSSSGFEIIGVVKDFHQFYISDQIAPMAMFYNKNDLNKITLRLSGGDVLSTIARIEKRWGEFVPEKSFDPVFLDQKLNSLFRSDQRFATLVSISTLVAIIIAALGLFGLAAHTAITRKREIGIRKIVGASQTDLTMMMVKLFYKPVGVALLIASPLAWFFMNKWLDNFAYRITIGPGIFIVSALTAFLIVTLTVGSQAIKAAQSNPIETLKAE
jgi:putative ABC transport system permease protein